MSTSTIWITFQREGIHCYPAAKDLVGVEFLANPHRHIFHFRVEIEVYHDDRDIEFILFKREMEGLYSGDLLQLNHKSCEMIARDIMKYLKTKYGSVNIDGSNNIITRYFNIQVSEDGENGATIDGLL